jgi:CubicO group peptidase (beta-lactamase class C family)
VVGATVAVVRSNLTWTRGFGFADREAGINVTTSTLFGIGSVSKAFASALLSLYINDTSK